MVRIEGEDEDSIEIDRERLVWELIDLYPKYRGIPFYKHVGQPMAGTKYDSTWTSDR
jgi:hypothetical protein